MPAAQIFAVEHAQDTLIISPLANVTSLADQQVQKELTEMLSRLESGEAEHIVIDFGQIKYFGSSMLEAMRRLRKPVADRGGRVACCCVSQVGREILEMAQFNRLWPIHEDRNEALAAVRADGE